MSEKTSKVDSRDIKAGTVFSTRFEKNCIALGEPDLSGNFYAIDSMDHEAQYNSAMVTELVQPDEVAELVESVLYDLEYQSGLLGLAQANESKLLGLDNLERLIKVLRVLYTASDQAKSDNSSKK